MPVRQHLRKGNDFGTLKSNLIEQCILASSKRVSIECHKTKTMVITIVNHKELGQKSNQHLNQIDGFGFISNWITKGCKLCEPISLCVVIQHQIKCELISTLD